MSAKFSMVFPLLYGIPSFSSHARRQFGFHALLLKFIIKSGNQPLTIYTHINLLNICKLLTNEDTSTGVRLHVDKIE